MSELELEKTYLIKYLPKDLYICPSKEIIDIYIPLQSSHPILRIRRNGERYEMTKKIPQTSDVSSQIEHTILLSEEEFTVISKIEGKKGGSRGQ